ncbi:MAG TPA: carboxypeptidase-like regulatory domain-containing protein, partial [Methanocella sp.]|nr:carboxypeptidase-like regulatory domain-containing protein [Methanocella sp.]
AQGGNTITGVVLSSIGSQSVPDATVTLYDMDGYLVDVPDNPQQSSLGVGTSAGVYTFYDVPMGTYNVTAEKNGVLYFAYADLTTEGTATANIVLPDYAEPGPISGPSGPPLPGAYYYFLPIRPGKAEAASSVGEGLLFGMALIGGIGAIALFAGRKWVLREPAFRGR